MEEFDPKLHSIFIGRHRAQCNACVGENGCADFETYAIGYFDAAKLILRQVLDPQKCHVQDQLVYPILFNFRHGIELGLKFVSKHLEEVGIKPSKPNYGTHELDTLWAMLLEQSGHDRRLQDITERLSSAIDQIHEADPLAQEFRYSVRKDGVPSLKDRSIVDLATVLQLLSFTKDQFEQLFSLVYRIIEERRLGSFTAEFNRSELERLSLELPSRPSWKKTGEFGKVQERWIKKYKLTNRAFCRAIEFIQSHKEFAGNIGQYSELNGIDDDELESILIAARKLRDYEDEYSSKPFQACFHEKEREFFAETGVKLTPGLVTCINALFYLSRDKHLSEVLTQLLDRFSYKDPHTDENILWADFSHVFEKTNFIDCICNSLKLAGRPDLSEKFGVHIKLRDSSTPLIREYSLSDFLDDDESSED